MGNIDARSTNNFLIYADSVNRARAIPLVEDNLKPIHRKILYTFYIEKLTSDKNYAKSMATVGDVMKYFSPHGDTATYEALARLAQSWKLRYPLVDGKGNFGSLLDAKPAAARYTDARLSKIGDLMLEDIDKNCVDFGPNYDESTMEPYMLPSKFPFILCGNNDGIGVSISSNIVSHNFTEVKGAIEYYLDHKDTCTTADLMKFIKGPDFPTGGRILNGEDLYSIYESGNGVIKMEGHYDVTSANGKPLIIFHDVPYGVQIEDNVIIPIKKYVIEENFDGIENVSTKKTKKDRFDITFFLGKKANVAQCLNIILTKTKLAASIKVNNIFVTENRMKLLSLKDMVKSYVDNRHKVIARIAQNDYEKIQDKLTVVIGLEKCLSNIDRVISIIRNADSSVEAKSKLMPEFNLTERQADAILEMKLGRLNRLDVKDLHDKQDKYESQLKELKARIEDEKTRDQVIKEDLAEIKKIIGADERQTEITYSATPVVYNENNEPIITEIPAEAVKKTLFVYDNGQITDKFDIYGNLIGVVKAYGQNDVCLYNANGEVGNFVDKPIGAFNKNSGTKIVCLTKNGNIKCSLKTLYKFNGKTEKLLKLKEGDELMYAAAANDTDYVILINDSGSALKLAIKDLTLATKATVGVKSGFNVIISAVCCNDGDTLYMVGSDLKGKRTPVKDFVVNSRGNKGQSIYEKTRWIGICNEDIDGLYVVPVRGNNFLIKRVELSTKSKTAAGANISSRQIIKIV